MIQGLEIEGFRGISARRIPLTPLTLLVGLNGSGKTTVLEALYLSSAHPVGRAWWPSRSITLEDRDPSGRSPILHLLRRHGGSGEADRLPDLDLSIGSSSGPGSTRIHEVEVRVREPRCLVHAGMDQAILRVRSPATTLPAFDWDEGRAAVLMDRFSDGLEEGLWFPRDPADPSRLVEPPILIGGREEWVVERLRQVYPGLPIRRLAGGGRHTVWAVVGDRPIPIGSLGDGIRAALRALSLLALVEGGLFLWDEPEAHQHPEAQARLMGILVETLRQRPGLQAVVATQSGDVLGEISRILRDGEGWLREAFSLLFLALDPQDGRLYAEGFTAEEFVSFEEVGDIRRFWTGRRPSPPRQIPPELLERLGGSRA